MKDGIYEWRIEGISNGIAFGVYLNNKAGETRTMIRIDDLKEAEKRTSEEANEKVEIGDLYQIGIKNNNIEVRNHLLDGLNKRQMEALNIFE